MTHCSVTQQLNGVRLLSWSPFLEMLPVSAIHYIQWYIVYGPGEVCIVNARSAHTHTNSNSLTIIHLHHTLSSFLPTLHSSLYPGHIPMYILSYLQIANLDNEYKSVCGFSIFGGTPSVHKSRNIKLEWTYKIIQSNPAFKISL